MSSNYYPLCLNHDPALALWHHDWDNVTSVEQEIAASRQRKGQYADHGSCDLLIARSSGGLVQIGCPAICHPVHAGTVWVDVGWLHLYAWALAEKAKADPIVFRVPLCWTASRVRRLGRLFEADDAGQ